MYDAVVEDHRRSLLRWVGGGVVVIAVPFLVPFLEAAINGRRVYLWPNPLFLVPLAAAVIGLLAIGFSFWPRRKVPGDSTAGHWDTSVTLYTEVQKQMHEQAKAQARDMVWGPLDRPVDGSHPKPREVLLDHLAGWMEQGEVVLYKIKRDAESGKPTPLGDPSTPPLWLAQAQQWTDGVGRWLAKHFGRPRRTWFDTHWGVTLTRTNPISQAAEFADHRRIWEGIARRLEKLNAMLEELSRG